MEAMKEAWTDARLDDLNGRVADIGRRMDEGFNRIHEDLRSLRTETKAEIGALRRELREELHGEIGALRGEIGSLHRLILQVAGGMFATFVVGFVGLVATRL
jgi:hypothetical protein